MMLGAAVGGVYTTAAFRWYDGTAWQDPIKRSLGTAKGDILHYTASDTAARLAVGATGQVLGVASGDTAWQDPAFLDTLFRVVDDGDTTKKVALQCSGITTATTRTLGIFDTNGSVVPVGTTTSAAGTLGTINLTGQLATVAPVTLLTGGTGTAGLYRISVYMVITTVDTIAGTLTCNVAWNDGAAQTDNSQVITTTNVLNSKLGATFVVRSAASQNITVGATLVKTTAPAYSLYARIEALG